MALIHRPHLVTVIPGEEDIDPTTKIVNETVYEEPEEPVIFLAQLTVKTTSRIWEDYAVETQHPALLMFNLEDIPKIRQGDRISCLGVEWQVKTEPSPHQAQSVTNHAHVILEKLNA